MVKLNRRIRIYYIEEDETDDGLFRIKHYLNIRDGYFKAAFRNLSSNEILKNMELKEDCSVQFIVNRRPIDVNMYIEFKRDLYSLKTYQITSIDPYDDRARSYYTIKAKEINPEPFNGEEWSVGYGMD